MNISPLYLDYEKICFESKDLMLAALKNMCQAATTTRPLYYMIAALALQIAEMIIRRNFKENIQFTLFKENITPKIDLDFIVFCIGMTKSICIIAAILFLIFGINAFN